jgi:uroporphyrinogen-III synthase
MTEFALHYTWIVTKSQPHADSLVIQLRRQNIDALALCCVEHQWRDWPELHRLGANAPALVFVTSRAAAARIQVSQVATVAAISPVTSATLEARGISVSINATGGVRDLARAVNESRLVIDGTEVFYPTSDAALRQPEHQAAVAALSQRLKVRVQAVYSTVAPANLAQELAALGNGRSDRAPGFVFWSPSAIENFVAARGFELPPAPVVLVGGSTERSWQEIAPPAWRRAFRHDVDTPLEWSLRFLERSPEGSTG